MWGYYSRRFLHFARWGRCHSGESRRSEKRAPSIEGATNEMNSVAVITSGKVNLTAKKSLRFDVFVVEMWVIRLPPGRKTVQEV